MSHACICFSFSHAFFFLRPDLTDVIVRLIDCLIQPRFISEFIFDLQFKHGLDFNSAENGPSKVAPSAVAGLCECEEEGDSENDEKAILKMSQKWSTFSA